MPLPRKSLVERLRKLAKHQVVYEQGGGTSEELAEAADAIDARNAEIAALKTVLADLHAVQNGPPLIRDEAIWQSAMDNAERLLGLAAQQPGEG